MCFSKTGEITTEPEMRSTWMRGFRHEAYGNKPWQHLFLDRLHEFSHSGTEIDLGYWMQCYTFDVIGCITYGERYGFLDEGQDIQGAIQAVGSIGRFSTLMGIYSEWYPLAFKLNGYLNDSGAGGRTFVANFAREKIEKHKQEQQEEHLEKGGDVKILDRDGISREPFMTKMIKSHRQDPEKVTDYHLFMVAQSNVIAGFDTTAISLTAMMYHLLKTPRVLQKLRDELNAARASGKLTGKDRINFHESQDLPYFKVVVKEALRVHSAAGLPFWRVVPEGGVDIEGIHFPEGTVLGVSSWVAHYNEDVFTDPTEFRPERWIDQDETNLKAMNELYMPFGLGSRTCIGRHISTLEMSKLIPVLVDKFDFEIVSSPAKEGDWETENFWFVKPHNLKVRVYERR
ncbi:benzoate 4-monooxygenase cytochrome P450, putative [Talaromyces marneffei ATCC 18224]|uniref:Benzoate 4-monooxygenase cytochrome P450, putative n=1 Tax=Talaromyces marneffei (strain ATCC 18224 / CBS 334.59 / QM 7333) TaxID=441960 RepID=B6QBW5_TALMQ|nr:benzoate 4-monooxygenase cytochrome P450, putative [Talaromyces marneffei ATCC 18224]